MKHRRWSATPRDTQTHTNRNKRKYTGLQPRSWQYPPLNGSLQATG